VEATVNQLNTTHNLSFRTASLQLEKIVNRSAGHSGRFERATYPMPIEITLHRWESNTRPCDFSLNIETPRGTVFADFDDLAEDGVTLRRISFDGYGCCETEGRCAALSSSEATTLLDAIRENDVNNKSILDILRRYFAENASILGSDALDEHQLNRSGPNVR
jgi:hypothetical protein